MVLHEHFIIAVIFETKYLFYGGILIEAKPSTVLTDDGYLVKISSCTNVKFTCLSFKLNCRVIWGNPFAPVAGKY